MSGYARARLLVEDGSKIVFWLNPTTLQRGRRASFDTKPPIGKPAAKGTYLGGKPDALSLTALLHAAGDRDGSDVQTAIESFEALLEPSVDEVGDSRNRPPTVQLTWGRYTSFKAVCESVSTTIELFDSWGRPLRALVAIALVQFEPEPEQEDPGGQNPTTRATQRRRAHLVRAGDSLASIAQAHLGDPTRWRAIAEVNGIDDPLRLMPGTTLTVPLEAR